MVDNKGLRECVNFTGFVDNLDLFYRNIDLLCFPSRLNAVGRPVFEAGFYGKPSIVAINQSWQDTVVDGVSGIIVSENNPEEIAMAIEELYRNKNILKKMGEKAREIARRYYEPTKNAKLMYCLYQNIIKGK